MIVFKKTKPNHITELEQHPIQTIVHNDVTINGNINAETNIRVDGKVTGNIITKQGMVIGENAHIEGDLESEFIIIYGKLSGNIKAKGLYLKESGIINGDISVEQIEIEKGGKYNGRLNMSQATAAPDIA